MRDKKRIKKFNSVIQACPKCGKLDVYKGDKHEYNRAYQQQRIESQEYYD